MAEISKIKTEVITRIALAGCRVLSRMNDRTMLSVMRAIKPLVGEPAAREGLEEIIDALSAGPPNTTLLKRMMAETKYEELRDIIAGLFSFRQMDIEDF
ncbi:MAG: hypothetical protein WCX65_05640 [bacterium]